jgi:hypothetical protein
MFKTFTFATLLAVAVLAPVGARLNHPVGPNLLVASTKGKNENRLLTTGDKYTVTFHANSLCVASEVIEGTISASVKTSAGVPVNHTKVSFTLTSDLSEEVYTGSSWTSSKGTASFSFLIDPIDEGTVLDCSATVQNENLPNDQTADCIFKVANCVE